MKRFPGRALLLAGFNMMLTSCVAPMTDRAGPSLHAYWNSQRAGAPPGRDGTGRQPWPEVGGERISAYIYEGIAVKDYEYQNYKRLIRRGVSWGGFGAQAASIGLGAAGGLVSGSAQVLSGAASAVNGTSAAFDKHILYDQTITVLIAKMDALRATKLKQIEDYGYQGSIDAALGDVAKQAGIQEAKAKSTPTPAARASGEE